MEIRRAGRSGLRVSSIGLGTMTWGRDTDEHDAAEQLEVFLEAGGNLIDTAASYGDGSAEELVGTLLRGISRHEVVLCSKAGIRSLPDGPVIDASRATLLDTLDESLARMGTDHLDLWLVHSPDLAIDPHETLSALHQAVSSGRTRYVGLSNHPAWLTGYFTAGLQQLGSGLVAVEVEHSLLQRSAEDEVLPAAAALGLGVLGWSPLGRGVLTGKYRHSLPADSRAASAHLRGFVEPYLSDGSRRVVEAVVTAADGLDRSPLEVAMAWARNTPGMTSAILGARSAAQLRGALAGADLVLPEAIYEALAEVSAPPSVQ